jgi:hypothetical protein
MGPRAARRAQDELHTGLEHLSCGAAQRDPRGTPRTPATPPDRDPSTPQPAQPVAQFLVAGVGVDRGRGRVAATPRLVASRRSYRRWRRRRR